MIGPQPMSSHVARMGPLTRWFVPTIVRAWAAPLVLSLGLAVVYFVAARLCVILADTGKSPAALWVPSGVALAALVHFGPRVAPGVFAGSLAANLVVDVTPPGAVLLAIGNLLAALIGVWGIRRHAGRGVDFGHTRDVLTFIAFGGLVGPSVSAALGIASLQLGGLYDSLQGALGGWISWWLEDGLSVLVVSSVLLLTAKATPRHWPRRTRVIEAGALLALLALVGWAVLTGPHGDPRSEPYLALPVLVWVVLRLGPPGAILGNLLLTILAGWSVVNREGPFVLDSLAASMVWMQAFSAVASLTTLLLAAALNDARAERYRQMFDGNRTVQLVVEAASGRIVDANPAACAFYGHSSAAMRQLALGELSAEPIEDSARALPGLVTQGGGTFVRPHTTAGGEVREVEVHCNPIQIDGRALVYAIVHDMSARREAEEGLRKSEERLQLVARATNDTVWDWDMRADRMWHNHGLRTVFGHLIADDEAIGLDWLAERIHPEDRDRVLATIDAAVLRGDETWCHEYRFQRGDDSFAHVLARGYIRYEGGSAARMVGVVLDLSERKRVEEELAYRATHDTLTGLANRSLIESVLQQSIATARRDGSSFGLLIVDLDRFKEVNDTLGHHTGDAVLQVVAERWRSILRECDTLGRLAGDEFALVLPQVDEAAAERVAQRLVSALRAPINIDGQQVQVGASVGVATFPTHAGDIEGLLRRADDAMYAMKRRGGGCPNPAEAA
jgi:diguanylate cyclase (GGDEF)-like protein/PAS domain S-box-containing protein